MSEIALAAVALMLVFEGIFPFVAPRAWRETMRRVGELTDGQLRFVGLGSMLAGLALLFVTR
jgi:uncharacterized protein YjeT (DUF2065 family)